MDRYDILFNVSIISFFVLGFGAYYFLKLKKLVIEQLAEEARDVWERFH